MLDSETTEVTAETLPGKRDRALLLGSEQKKESDLVVSATVVPMIIPLENARGEELKVVCFYFHIISVQTTNVIKADEFRRVSVLSAKFEVSGGPQCILSTGFA